MCIFFDNVIRDYCTHYLTSDIRILELWVFVKGKKCFEIRYSVHPCAHFIISSNVLSVKRTSKFGCFHCQVIEWEDTYKVKNVKKIILFWQICFGSRKIIYGPV